MSREDLDIREILINELELIANKAALNIETKSIASILYALIGCIIIYDELISPTTDGGITYEVKRSKVSRGY